MDYNLPQTRPHVAQWKKPGVPVRTRRLLPLVRSIRGSASLSARPISPHPVTFALAPRHCPWAAIKAAPRWVATVRKFGKFVDCRVCGRHQARQRIGTYILMNVRSSLRTCTNDYNKVMRCAHARRERCTCMRYTHIHVKHTYSGRRQWDDKSFSCGCMRHQFSTKLAIVMLGHQLSSSFAHEDSISKFCHCSTTDDQALCSCDTKQLVDLLELRWVFE